MKNRCLRISMLAVLLLIITIIFTVLHNNDNKKKELTNLKSNMVIEQSANLNDVSVAPQYDIKSMSDKDIKTLYEKSNPLPWSDEKDFSRYHIGDSIYVYEDLESTVQILLNKPYKVKESSQPNFYYQIVTTDQEVVLIPKAEDCNYIVMNGEVHFNTITSDCVEAIFRLRMYHLLNQSDFKILDYYMEESKTEVKIVYYKAKKKKDGTLQVNEVTETVSKGNGELTTSECKY